MEFRHAFAKALKHARKARGLTQEDFSDVSSRTYLSTLERGQKCPTLGKTYTLAQTIGVHFLTLLTLTTINLEEENDIEQLFTLIRRELNELNNTNGEDVYSNLGNNGPGRS
jgi:transcriptional regulator with XRE-family HTH domain